MEFEYSYWQLLLKKDFNISTKYMWLGWKLLIDLVIWFIKLNIQLDILKIHKTESIC